MESEFDTKVTICKLALDESIRGLGIQESTLSSIRQTAAALGTLAGLAATFIGSEILPALLTESNLGISTLALPGLAIFTLFCSVVLIVLILNPRKGWIFHMSANSILKQFANRNGKPVNLDVTYGVLAKFNETNYEKNDQMLERLFKSLSILTITVVAQIVFWLLALL